jgi:hypothetical protein
VGARPTISQKAFMAKSPIQIANIMADAANKKSQQPDDADEMPTSKKKPKQVAAAKEQEKAKGKMPPIPAKKSMPPKGM